MSTLTATPLPALAAIRLEAAGLPGGTSVITRTDANGSAAVRLLSGQTSIGGTLVATDYEAALTGTVTYAVDNATAAVTLAVPFPVLLSPTRPNLRAALSAVTDFSESTTSPAEVVRILDRDDPIIFDAPHYLPATTMTAWCATYADALAVAKVARAGRVLMFRQADHAGMDRYFRAVSSSIVPLSEATATRRWSVRIDGADVARPSSPLLAAAGWDFAAVAATYPSFTAVKNAFTTFDRLTVGP